MQSGGAECIGAIDQGTTSTRFIIFDHHGDIVVSHQKEHEQIYPYPGWCEHDPLDILANTEEVITEALRKAGLPKESLKAVGVTNQRETTVIWDKHTGKPLHNAIVWNDTRTSEIAHRLANGEGPYPGTGKGRFQHVTGLPIATYFSAAKIIWMLENVPLLREKCENGEALFGTIDTWLLWNLTGGPNGGIHVTDVTNASRTNLMRLENQTWEQEILDALNIPMKILPKITSSSEIYGYFHQQHVLAGIPLAGNLGDQHAALFGQTCFSPGEAKNTYGTGCFFIINTGKQMVNSNHGLLTTISYKIGDQPTVFALEGSVAVAGSLVQWLRDNLNIIDSADQVEELARKVEDNGGVYFVPAFSGLFAPHWRDDARGVIVGMTSYCNRNHIARAALEATAFQTREVVEAVVHDSGVPLKKLKVDGGMVVNETLMQFQADILNVPVIRPKINETTALGAAYAAGLAVGFWKDQEELSCNWKALESWEPSMNEENRDKLFKKWQKAVARTLDWEEE